MSERPGSTPVEQERINAAVARIERVIARLASSSEKCARPSELRLLREAKDLLDPEVKLA